jgi:hypothetical protein
VAAGNRRRRFADERAHVQPWRCWRQASPHANDRDGERLTADGRTQARKAARRRAMRVSVSAAAPAWSIRDVTDSIANGERTAVEVLDTYLQHVRSHPPPAQPTPPDLCAVGLRRGVARCEGGGRSVPCQPIAPFAIGQSCGRRQARQAFSPNPMTIVRSDAVDGQMPCGGPHRTTRHIRVARKEPHARCEAPFASIHDAD